MQEVYFIERADEASEVLQPIRIEILSRLTQPKTCPELAADLGIATQKVNYHMNVLKEAGLVTLVEERRKRGTVEGVYEAVAKSFWFSPRLVTQVGSQSRLRDQASLAYLLQLSEELQIEIGHLMERGQAESMPSLGVNAQIQLSDKSDRAQFLIDVKEMFSALAEKYGASVNTTSSENGYRLMLACYHPLDRDNKTFSE